MHLYRIVLVDLAGGDSGGKQRLVLQKVSLKRFAIVNVPIDEQVTIDLNQLL